MAFETTADVTTLQAQVEIQVTDLDAAVNACMLAGKLSADSTDATQWANLKRRAIAFEALEPSTLHASSQAATGRAILSDLSPWFDKLRAMGCANVPPTPPLPTPPTNPLAGTLGSIERIVLLVVILEALRTFRK